MSDWTLHHGDCRDVMAGMDPCSVDAVVCDPPYELAFMGNDWDGAGVAYDPETWRQALRVLKPGGHLVAFGGTRTWHRMVVAIEDAGFEVRDSIAWLYGSGFPKSHDVSKAIDRAAGAERQTKPWLTRDREGVFAGDGGDTTATSGNLQCPECMKWKFAPDYCKCPRDDGPQSVEARRWDGWGTALKPAHEPVCVARKPMAGTVAANVLAHGTGALNIDGCRIEGAFESGWSQSGSKASTNDSMSGDNYADEPAPDNTAGRWPANVVLDDTTATDLDQQTGVAAPKAARTARKGGCTDNGTLTGYGSADDVGTWPADAGGGASRYFYCAKAPQTERPRLPDGTAHPTVKPLDLMRWLVRLVTPPGGTVLDPFAGSGTTGEACIIEGFDVVLIEGHGPYLDLIRQRLGKPIQPTLGAA